MKPGGHGALWKLAARQGAFDWLKGMGRDCALIRQVNNPLGGIDQTLFALAGEGISNRKSFGFACCEISSSISWYISRLGVMSDPLTISLPLIISFLVGRCGSAIVISSLIYFNC